MLDIFLLGVLLTFIAAVMAFGFWYSRRLERENKELKDAQAKRLPHDAAAALEDTIASLLNAKRIHDSLKNDADALEYWLDKAGEFGRGARGGNGYDPDKPTGNERRRA